MWRVDMVLLLLAITSGALLLIGGSVVASGVAALLFIAFIGVFAVVLAISWRESRRSA
jgi:hypothetical protein